MNFKNIEETIKLISSEELQSTIENLSPVVEDSNKEFANNIYEAAEKEIKPDQEEGKKLLDFGNLIREFGYKLLNLLNIEITCSFAGVTLFHWSIPKVKNGKCVDNKVTTAKKL